MSLQRRFNFEQNDQAAETTLKGQFQKALEVSLTPTQRAVSSRTFVGLLPYLGFAAALLAAHYYLNDSHTLIHAVILPLLLLPLTYICGAFGLRGAAAGMALSIAFLGDDVIHAHHNVLAFEVLFVISAGGFGLLLGAAASFEIKEEQQMRKELLTQMELLTGEPGYWYDVALTRMGLYVTRLESRFLEAVFSGCRPQAIADIGAGCGRLEFALLRQGGRVVATEVNQEDLLAMEHHPRLTGVRVGDYPSLPFQDQCLDAIVAIEAPAASDQPWFKEECARVLRPRGSVVVTIHNAASYKGAWRKLRSRTQSRQSKAASRVGLYYRRSLPGHLNEWRAAGFAAAKLLGFYWAPVPRQSDSAWVNAVSVLERAFGLRLLARWSPWVLVELRRQPGGPPTKAP